MTKVITWNIGSMHPLIYLKNMKLTYRGQEIIHEYFQPYINGGFVSKNINEINPDIMFLQEVWNSNDLGHIDVLKNYPYQKLLNSWYHENSVLVASKYEFTVKTIGNFNVVNSKDINYIPVHLNSFSAKTRFEEIKFLNTITKDLKNCIVLGDTNIWSRNKFFLFKNDEKAYKKITESLLDFSIRIVSTSVLGFCLDKIFGSSNLNIKNINSPRIRGDFMDHYPISFDVL